MAKPEDEWPQSEREENARLEAMSCCELRDYLEQHWETLLDGTRYYVSTMMADKGCCEAIPYILRRLRWQNPQERVLAMQDLEKLKCRECRVLLIEYHVSDPDEHVRAQALVCLSSIFGEEKDVQILRLALAAFEAPAASVATRLAAAVAMAYQLRVPEELGWPGWWNEEAEDLDHPALQWAVAETRRLLAAEDTAG